MPRVIPFPGSRSRRPNDDGAPDGPAGLESGLDLIERLRSGDPVAMTEVYRAHHGPVRAYARRMLHDPSEAEDVVHDAFVALPSALERFRGDAALKTFLISIAVNLCRRRLRSSGRQQRAIRTMAEKEPPTMSDSPEVSARRKQLAGALRRGLETLSLEHREVFMLCTVEERTSREVAEILEIPEGTVRTRLFFARKKLRAFLAQEGVQ